MGGRPVTSAARGLWATRLFRIVAGAGIVALVVVAVVFAVGAIKDAQPGMRDNEELQRAISDVQGYECESALRTGPREEFSGGVAQTWYCTLFEKGKRVFGEGGLLEMVVVTPPDAMDEFVAHNRATTRGKIPAIVGENWFIPGLSSEEGQRVRRDLLGALEGAREGEYGVFRRR